MAEVITTDAFTDWFRDLDEADREKVAHYVDLLERVGVNLDHPYCSAVNGSRHGGGLRELRVQAQGRPLRVFYRFDRRRNAVVLCGGNKEGVKQSIFYAEAISVADTAWDHWLEYGAAQYYDDE